MIRRRHCALTVFGVAFFLAAATLPLASSANEANMNEPVIVAFGDSLTSGLGLAESAINRRARSIAAVRGMLW